MAYLILPSRRIVQPSGPVEVDRRFGDPSVWLPSCGLRDLAGYSPWAATSYARNGVGRNGRSFARGGADYNTAYSWAPRPDYAWESWLLWFDVWPAASYAIYGASASDRINGGGGALLLSATALITPTYGVDSGSLVYVRIKTGNHRMAVKKSTGSVSDQVSAATYPAASMQFAGRYGAAALNLAVRWTNEEPSDEQLYRLLHNPWQIAKPVQRRIWIDMGAGSSGGGDIALAGAALSVAGAGGALETAIPLTGAAASLSSAGASLTARIALAGSALAQAVSSALLSSGITMTADAVAEAAAQGTLETAIQMLGGAQAQAAGSGSLSTGSGGLEGHAQASASAGASLSTQIRLGGAAIATAGASGSLGGSANLAGTAVSTASANGELIVNIALTAQALVSAIATGSLTAQIWLDADAAAQAQAGAQLSGGGGLVIAEGQILVAAQRRRLLDAVPRARLLACGR